MLIMVNLRKLQKSNKEYFYLEHTIRDGDSFKNKRLYLKDELPRNLDELKEDFIIQILTEIYENKLKQIREKFQTEYNSYPKSYKEKYIESFMIKFTYNTNKIEGGTLTLKETADLLQEHITPKNKSLKDVKETESHRNVFYRMYEDNNRLTLAKVLFWHKELFKDADPEIAGKIRTHPVVIARSKTEMPLPIELNFILVDFFKWYDNNYSKIHPVIFAALVHLKFVTIHPFSDGNGRISRLMMNHTLKNHGYPMLNVEYNNRSAYYNALEHSQTKNQSQVFINYFVKRCLK